MEYVTTVDLNTAIFIGIDAHPTTHTALAINRFEEEQGHLTFDNTPDGITTFLSWFQTVAPDAKIPSWALKGGAPHETGCCPGCFCNIRMCMR